jgi:hypothetical protein
MLRSYEEIWFMGMGVYYGRVVSNSCVVCILSNLLDEAWILRSTKQAYNQKRHVKWNNHARGEK